MASCKPGACIHMPCASTYRAGRLQPCNQIKGRTVLPAFCVELQAFMAVLLSRVLQPADVHAVCTNEAYMY